MTADTETLDPTRGTEFVHPSTHKYQGQDIEVATVYHKLCEGRETSVAKE